MVLFRKLNLAVAADCFAFKNCLSRPEVGREISSSELEDSVEAPSEFRVIAILFLASTNSPFFIGDTLLIGVLVLVSFRCPNGLTVIRGVTFLSTPNLGASGFKLWGRELKEVFCLVTFNIFFSSVVISLADESLFSLASNFFEAVDTDTISSSSSSEEKASSPPYPIRRHQRNKIMSRDTR